MANTKLNEAQKRFCEIYMTNGFKAAEAYRDSHPDKPSNSAPQEAYRYLRMEKIQKELESIESTYRLTGLKIGINKERILNKLSRMMDATKGTKKIRKEDGTEEEVDIPDWKTINDAINTYAKLTGDFTDRKKITIEDGKDMGDIDPTSMNIDELDKLREDLMKGL